MSTQNADDEKQMYDRSVCLTEKMVPGNVLETTRGAMSGVCVAEEWRTLPYRYLIGYRFLPYEWDRRTPCVAVQVVRLES